MRLQREIVRADNPVPLNDRASGRYGCGNPSELSCNIVPGMARHVLRISVETLGIYSFGEV